MKYFNFPDTGYLSKTASVLLSGQRCKERSLTPLILLLPFKEWKATSPAMPWNSGTYNMYFPISVVLKILSLGALPWLIWLNLNSWFQLRIWSQDHEMEPRIWLYTQMQSLRFSSSLSVPPHKHICACTCVLFLK